MAGRRGLGGGGSAQSGQLQPAGHKPIAQSYIDPGPEPRIGDAGLVGVADRVDDGQPLADHRSREGRGQRVADLDKAAALVGWR